MPLSNSELLCFFTTVSKFCYCIKCDFFFLFQESEKGYWHVPLAPGTSCESTRCWLCITRPCGHDVVATVSNGVSSLDSQVDENNATSVTGKRKERSPPS